jgi:putative glutamine amidotransferase
VVHDVALTPGSGIHRRLGQDRVAVASHHHQALDTLGAGLVVTGRSEDGVIEAVELPAEEFYVGVQWHPERTADPAAGDRLFDALLAAARAHRAGSGVDGAVTAP